MIVHEYEPNNILDIHSPKISLSDEIIEQAKKLEHDFITINDIVYIVTPHDGAKVIRTSLDPKTLKRVIRFRGPHFPLALPDFKNFKSSPELMMYTFTLTKDRTKDTDFSTLMDVVEKATDDETIVELAQAFKKFQTYKDERVVKVWLHTYNKEMYNIVKFSYKNCRYATVSNIYIDGTRMCITIGSLESNF